MTGLPRAKRRREDDHVAHRLRLLVRRPRGRRRSAVSPTARLAASARALETVLESADLPSRTVGKRIIYASSPIAAGLPACRVHEVLALVDLHCAAERRVRRASSFGMPAASLARSGAARRSRCPRARRTGQRPSTPKHVRWLRHLPLRAGRRGPARCSGSSSHPRRGRRDRRPCRHHQPGPTRDAGRHRRRRGPGVPRRARAHPRARSGFGLSSASEVLKRHDEARRLARGARNDRGGQSAASLATQSSSGPASTPSDRRSSRNSSPPSRPVPTTTSERPSRSPQIHAELVKLRTTRTPFAIAAGSLRPGRSHRCRADVPGRGDRRGPGHWPGRSGPPPPPAAPTLLALVLGTLAVTGEYRFGTIASTFLAEPRLVASGRRQARGHGEPSARCSRPAAAVVTLDRRAVSALRIIGETMVLPRYQNRWSLLAWPIAQAPAYAMVGVAAGLIVRNQVGALVGLFLWGSSAVRRRAFLPGVAHYLPTSLRSVLLV